MSSLAESGGNKASRWKSKIRNSDTVTILKGGPTFYAMTGTEDGLRAVSAENIANANHGLFAGIACLDIGLTKIRETQVGGICSYVRVALQTRPTTTDSWASQPAIVIGDTLNILSAPGVQAFFRGG